MGPGNKRGGLGTTWGAQRAEQFLHLGNYTLTPVNMACSGLNQTNANTNAVQ